MKLKFNNLFECIILYVLNFPPVPQFLTLSSILPLKFSMILFFNRPAKDLLLQDVQALGWQRPGGGTPIITPTGMCPKFGCLFQGKILLLGMNLSKISLNEV